MSGSERRLYDRVPLQGVGARLHLDDGSSASRKVELLDLSLGGVRWAGAEPVDTGTRVTISMRTRRLFGRTLRFEATIVRHDDAARMTAAQFVTISDRERMDAYLRGRAQGVRAPGRARVAADAALDAHAAFRLLAANLDRALPGGSRLVVVASPRHAEGKSFVAAGIATALAGSGRPVLLVDADLQAPTQHVRLLAQGSLGLAQLVAEPTTARAAALVQSTPTGVSLIAAGAAGTTLGVFHADSAELLAAALRGLGYPLVVIDAPAILTSAETLLFSRIADQTIVTLRSGETRERDARQALELLRRQGARSVGVVLNDHQDVLRNSRPTLGGTGLTPVAASDHPSTAARLPGVPPSVPVARSALS